MNRNYYSFRNIIISFVLLWLSTFVLFPSILVFITSFLTKDGQKIFDFRLTFENYTKLFDPMFKEAFLQSLSTSIISTSFCLIVSYPFAFCLCCVPEKIQKLMLFLIVMPFCISSLVRIYGLKTFLSKNGYLNDFLIWSKIISKPIKILYTKKAVIIGLVYIFVPFMIIPIYMSFKKINYSLIEAARDLGANKYQIFIKVIFPLTLPDIVYSFLLVFLSSISLFYISDLMGGSKSLLIGNIIKSQFLNLGDWPFGSATSIVLIIFTSLLLYFYYIISCLIKRKAGR
ncbi:spermidine/putrescine ABC transporter permease PotB [Candidatus Riesia pediculicola]|uniref:Spermidine/putrescine ABC transporter membrane component n=1 Tax=Riesia pediculicola (strain USDA) TaxID=515618 RepID=D4G8S3_RIEPU|nr:spermidine/putrescine ABC transporter permease PotB [Candidatus Riesia pediculicola]ADD79594.1 spermidine/putrescine ABC transporter membrane component [Candidatus Riesia pediculicola USDA]ARC53944.1 spermidine/putrescine ABC transporter permease [Candidatus Riesia pediculicola]QOJ86571.1 spermidine/putrescine ABC transporter permease PotB [Candidatus Riesia pediculicola]